VKHGCGVQVIPRDSSGTFTLPLGTLVNAGDTVLVSQHNPAMQDLASSLTNSLARDGRGGMTGPLNMGGNKLTNMTAGTAPGDSVTVSQLAAIGVTDALGTSTTAAPSQRAVSDGLSAISATVTANSMAQRGSTFPAVPIQSILNNQPVDLRELKLPGDPDWSNAIDKATAFGPVSIIVPASASGLPISRPFTQNAGGNQLIGLEGAGNCFFAIDPTFVAGGATGVMNIPSSASERGAGCDGVGFSFSQPASRTRANLVQYPFAINANNCTRPLFGNVRISGATNGMSLQGCGGMNANVLEIGCYGTGISIGSALDWVHINKYHFWPFGIASRSDLFAIYNDTNTIAWRSQRIDGLQVDNFDCLSGQIIFEADGAANGGFHRIGNMCLDSDNARIDVTSSRVDIGNLYATGTSADIYKIAHHGNGQSLLSIGFLRGTSASTTNPIVA
jgi:hypothetical protein